MDDYDIAQHPDLRDPEWQRRAVKQARAGVRRQRRTGKRLAWTGVSLVVVAGAVFGLVQWGRSTSAHYDGSAPPPAEMRPTAPQVMPDIARVDLARPFDNTPAATWGESVDGLVLPPASPIGAFSAGEVQTAVDQVKKFIHIGRLDRRTIEGHDGAALVDLLAPSNRSLYANMLNLRLTSEFANIVSYAADGYRLLPANPRISGTITAAPGPIRDTLNLHASYSVGYPFDPGTFAPILAPGEIDVFLRWEVDFKFTGSSHRKDLRGLSVGSTSGVVVWMGCEAWKKGYLAPAYSETMQGSDEPFDEAAVYDVTKPLPEVTEGCTP
ncbi:hypothetical protein [Amycolatopsis methanolica]|uniref:Uncharacterized protein n=1 Tax=Amycolatopsis methanolica 239 TaxID=1068978 RepID=A0A076MM84_AMYME|nr:hypothetical protein [Amycolatopsis methanolica]AIJ21844.1 hypothetical protein AMETH_1752 [Amycolatopsis methanolica 239]